MSLENMRWARALVILIVAHLIVRGGLEGQCVSSNRSEGDYVGYDVVQLVPNGIPAALMDELNPQEVGCGSPIVIDLDGRGIHFSDLRHGVQFDIDADGFLERTPWILPRSRDAFLAYDRNQNGSIDDGSELFGDATPFLNGTTTAQNGYQALFELDVVDGNGNGYIDREDRVFDKLLLWRDLNGNGVAEKPELSTLRENGVVALATEYRVSTRRDAHSNELRFVSFAWIEQRGTRELRNVETVDVVFPYEEIVE